MLARCTSGYTAFGYDADFPLKHIWVICVHLSGPESKGVISRVCVSLDVDGYQMITVLNGQSERMERNTAHYRAENVSTGKDNSAAQAEE